MASVSTVQRYYASAYGRFNTPDPYGGSAGPTDPGSWNRYSYALGDPVNGNDPRGLCVRDMNGDLWDDVQMAGGSYSEWIGDYACRYYSVGGYDASSISISDSSSPVPYDGNVPSWVSDITNNNFQIDCPVCVAVGQNMGGFDEGLGYFAGGSFIAGAGVALAPLAPAAAAGVGRAVAGLGRLAGGGAGRIAATLGTSGATIGGVLVSDLQQAMQSTGPTLRVVTQISGSAIDWTRSLYVGVGNEAMALAQEQGTGGKFFQADIPVELLQRLQQANLAFGGALASGQQIMFGAGAGQFISGFFSQVP
jgi:hypothetical protein